MLFDDKIIYLKGYRMFYGFKDVNVGEMKNRILGKFKFIVDLNIMILLECWIFF